MQTEALTGFRLSPLQTQLWRAEHALQGLRSQCAIEVRGPISANALRTALCRVAERHEILRTTFRRLPGMSVPVQVVGDEATVDWYEVDLRAVPATEQLAQVDTIVNQAMTRPFDFQREPLLRAALIALAAERHLLLLTLPALCADSSTLRAIVEETQCFYSGGAAAPGLPEQPLQYADFSEWHNQLLEGEGASELQAAQEFWAKDESIFQAPVQLALQNRTEAESPFEPRAIEVEIPSARGAQISQLARHLEVQPSSLLLACWRALLARLSGQSAIAVWSVVDGRNQDELAGTMGLYSQALPVSADAEDRSFAEMARRMERSAEASARWQEYYPAGSHRGSTESAALMQFEFDEWVATKPETSATFTFVRCACHLSRFAVKLSCTKGDDFLKASLFYDPRAFRREDVQRFARYFERLLGALTRDPDALPDAVEIIDEAERRHLIGTLSQQAADFPRERCVHELFEDQAKRIPGGPALFSNERCWTYAELNDEANRIAHLLREHGVGRNDRVGLCLERSAEAVVGLLGILKAGGAYVPLDPDLPQARLAYQIAEIEGHVLITREALLDRLPDDYQGCVLCIDRDRADLARQPNENPTAASDPSDLVYVIYTSGSTGTPKGVAVRHRNLVNYTAFLHAKLGLGSEPEGLVFATVSTLAADLGNTCVFPALTSGGCLHVIPYEISISGESFARYVAKHPIDVLKITPSHLTALLTEAAEVLPRHFLFLGGEAASWDLVREIRRIGTCAVINHYGPTETTVGSLTYSLPEETLFAPNTDSVPIGRPIANTEAYILDQRQQLVPFGVPGELYLGGAGVAQGYLNQPEQTAARFIRHPFSDDPSARLYRTGDQVRYLADGNIVFLGRMDRQVKIRGFRVELGEIEAVLRRHSAVQQAIVVAAEGRDGNKRLIAYVVPAARTVLPVDALRSFSQEHLPEPMVPAVFVALDSLPLTPNGKIDPRALPDPDLTRSVSEKPFLAPRNDTEERIAAIWQEILGLDQVSVDADFFDLGGHSLLATQVISRVNRAFQVRVPLRSIFDTPTVTGLAEAALQFRDEGTAEDVDSLLVELEGLSEEEVQRLLAMEMQQHAAQ